MAKQTESGLLHPKANLNTALSLATVASLGAGAVARTVYGANALRAAEVGDTGNLVVQGSEAAQAAEAAGSTITPLSGVSRARLAAKAANPLNKPPTGLRALNAPVESAVRDAEGNVVGSTVAHGGSVQLHASSNPLVYGAQKLHDVVVQKGLDLGTPGIAKYESVRLSV
jgi:hypothetical protein